MRKDQDHTVNELATLDLRRMQDHPDAPTPFDMDHIHDPISEQNPNTDDPRSVGTQTSTVPNDDGRRRVPITPQVIAVPMPAEHPAVESVPAGFSWSELAQRLTSRVFLLSLAVVIQCMYAGIAGNWESWQSIIKWEVATVIGFGVVEGSRDVASTLKR